MRGVSASHAEVSHGPKVEK